MKCNVGKKDRMLRILAGIVIIGWGFASKNIWGTIGIAPLLIGIIRWCPAYVLFNISTNKK